MILVILALYVSTTIYSITVLHEAFNQLAKFMEYIDLTRSMAWKIYTNMVDFYSQSDDIGDPALLGVNRLSSSDGWWARPMQQCTGTVTLTVNVCTGKLTTYQIEVLITIRR